MQRKRKDENSLERVFVRHLELASLVRLDGRIHRASGNVYLTLQIALFLFDCDGSTVCGSMARG